MLKAVLQQVCCGSHVDSCTGLEGSSRFMQRLAAFMPYAAEQTRQAQHDAASPLELDIIRSALRMTRQASASVGMNTAAACCTRCTRGF